MAKLAFFQNNGFEVVNLHYHFNVSQRLIRNFENGGKWGEGKIIRGIDHRGEADGYAKKQPKSNICTSVNKEADMTKADISGGH